MGTITNHGGVCGWPICLGAVHGPSPPTSPGPDAYAISTRPDPPRRRQKLLMVQDALRYAGVPERYAVKVSSYYDYLQVRYGRTAVATEARGGRV